MISIPKDIFKLIQETCVYFGGSLAAQSISMLAFPLWINFLTPTQFGVIALLQTTQLIFSTLTDLNLVSVVGLNYIHLSVEDRRRLITSVAMIYGCSFAACFLLLALVLPYLQPFLYGGSVSCTLLLGSVGISAGLFTRSLLFQLLRFAGNASYLTTLLLVENCTYIMLNCVLITRFACGPASILWAQAGSLGLVLFVYTWRAGLPSLQKPLPLLPIIREGGSLFPLTLGTHLLHIGDRLVLAHWCPLHTVGLYSFAAKFSQMVHTICIVPLQRAYLPFIQKLYHAGQATGLRTNRLLMGIYLALGTCGLTLLYSVGKPLLLYLTPATYHAGLRYIALLLLATILNGATTIFAGSFLRYAKQIQALATILLSVGCLNVTLNLLSVRTFGIIGCITSTIISSVVYLAWTWHRHTRQTRMMVTPARSTSLHPVMTERTTHEDTPSH